MKPLKNFFFLFFFCLIIFGVGAFVGVKMQSPDKPEYNNADSIRNASIDSVKGEYQQVIDSLDKVKPKIVYRIKWLKGADTIIYVGNDTACIEILERKNNLIQGLDSLCEVLDLEARTYSDLLLLETEKTQIEISRFNALSYKTDSIILNYKDSLTAQRKTIDKAIKKEKCKTFFYKVTTTVATALGIYGIISK